MTDLPRLTVTQEQAADLIDGYHVLGKQGGTLRLPERPTKPCPNHIFYGHDCPRCGGSGTVHKAVPIPEGTRVEVVYPCDECDTLDVGAMLDHRYGCQKCHGSTFVSVATATLAVVEVEYLMPPDMGECRYHVTLTDIEAVNDCDDGQPV